MERKLIDINELAAKLSIRPGTIYNWCSQRKIPFVKVRRALRFDPAEVEQIVKHCPKDGDK
jgi:excisionase family DNA binding protein